MGTGEGLPLRSNFGRFRRPQLLPRDLPGQREFFAPVELDPAVTSHLRQVKYDGRSPMSGRVHQVVGWEQWDYPQKMAFLRKFTMDCAKDPAIAQKAQRILRDARVPQRDHKGMWAALLKWVQTNIAYQNEPGERLCSPQHTLSTGGPADCDDCAILLAGLGESLRLPWRFVLTGRRKNGERFRWVEGMPPPPEDFNASHIFLQVGGPPFRPTWWIWAEPTLDVPLGWDLFKDRLPSGREDMAGHSLEGLAGVDEGVEGLLKGWLDHARENPWKVAAGFVLGFTIARAVEEMGKKRRK